MLTPIGIREEKNYRGTDRNLADFLHFARKNVPCKIATGGDEEGRGWGGGEGTGKDFDWV